MAADPLQARSSQRGNKSPISSPSRADRHGRVVSTPRSVKTNAGDRLRHHIRPDIVTEMTDEMHECPLDAFITDYAPFRPSQESINAAFQHYKATRLNENGPMWTDFYPRPSLTDQTEDKLFQRLNDIIGDLRRLECRAEGVDQTRQVQFKYRSCPNTTVAGEIGGTSFRMDACITSEPTSDVIVLADTAVILEFKKFSKDAHANREQLVSAASQIMNDDPRRTWIYGVTIEDNMMSVWYFCRSHSVKSGAFNFTTDIKTFVSVFMSFLYATAEEIGYDPTIRRVPYGKSFTYVYQLQTSEGPKYFRTIMPLFNSRVLCISGRKTRVWKAIEVGDFQNPEAKQGVAEVALKDMWLGNDSATEKETQEQIFRALREVKETDYDWAPEQLRKVLEDIFRNERYNDYFMEIRYDTLLSCTKPLSKAATPAPDLLRPVKVAATSGNVVEGSIQAGASSGVFGSSIRPHGKPIFPRKYQGKKHYRLVYGEIGHSLDRAANLKTSFTAVGDVFIALVLLYLARWVHRDISPGNIILVGEGENIRGKLSDLEYAKKFSTTAVSGDPKAGTPFFMAIEIHSSRPLAFSPQEESQSSDDSDPGRFDPSPSQSAQSPVARSISDLGLVAVQVRFQHDLESLWWIALWILLCRIKDPDASKLTVNVFTADYTPTIQRVSLFTGLSFKSILHGVIHPHLDSCVDHLDRIRVKLFNSYTRQDNSRSRDPNSYGQIYRKVWKELACLTAGICARGGAIPLGDGFRRVQPANNVRLGKRAQSEIQDDDDFLPPEEANKQELPKPNKRPRTRQQARLEEVEGAL